tara:strand:- start:307 stop:468 length:162 start_codon:yes stop_codon:yes gene_type:complete
MKYYNEIKLLHKYVSLLKRQLEDARTENKRLRKELAIVTKDNSFKSQTSWVEK